jgi:hypothetical protein
VADDFQAHVIGTTRDPEHPAAPTSELVQPSPSLEVHFPQDDLHESDGDAPVLGPAVC